LKRLKNQLPKIGLLSLRGTGILAKFLLTFLITKKISLDFQGSFSLITTSITLLVLLFGLDFYIYSNKLIIQDKSKAIFYLKNNLLFYCLVYAIFIPIIYFVFIEIFSDTDLNVYLFLFVVILEHLGQEFFRIYIALQRVYLANILLFIRTGLWASLVVVYLFFAEVALISINDLLLVWVFSALLTTILSFYYYPQINLFFQQKIDYTWIKKGITIAGQMFLTTIFLKIIEFADRYIIDYYYDKEIVGIYTFYYQMANLSNVIIFTLYISFLYPKLIESIYKNDIISTANIQRDIKTKTIIVIVATAFLFILILPTFLSFVDRVKLYEYNLLLFGFLAANLFINLSYAGHYTLIGHNQERKILGITFVIFLFNIVASILLIKYYGIFGAIISQITSSFLLFIFKNRTIKKVNL
jgi:O-antigen/teichoic acid export membrane protein